MSRKRAVLKVYALIVTISVIAFGSVGLAQDKNEEAENKILKLSLQDALKISEQNNSQVKLSMLELEKAQLAKKQLEYSDKKAKQKEEDLKELLDELGNNLLPPDGMPDNSAIGTFSTSDFEYKYTMELGKKRADLAVKMAEKGIDATLRNIRFGVEAAYYAALSARDNLQIMENALDRQKEILKISKAKYELGACAKAEVLDAEVQVANAETSLLQAQVEKEKAYINLKKLLGFDMGQEIELTDEFEFQPLDEKVMLDDLIQEAKENRIDIISAVGLCDIAQLDFELTSKVYPSNTFNYKQKEYDLEEAKVKAEDTVNSAEAEIRQTVLDLDKAEANIPLLDKTLESAQESFRLAKLSYEAGLLRSVDVTAAEQGLRQVELQRSQVIYSYNLMLLKLENVAYIPVSNFSL
ncbi:MAG: TolC family protein [Tepidanaerobacteraceae bacterium]|jgi:outer membrane protein TolC